MLSVVGGGAKVGVTTECGSAGEDSIEAEVWGNCLCSGRAGRAFQAHERY